MTEILLYGTVGEVFWDEEYFTASEVARALAAIAGPVTVRLNSGGGIVTEGQAIYNLLRAHPGEVHVIIDGVAASSASLIAMAGDTITMPRGSWMLIHDPAQLFGQWRGTADDHRGLANFLDKIGDGFADVYAARAGITREAAREIMRAETVYLGPEAVAAGFATYADAETEAAAEAAFDYRIYAHAPERLRVASERLGNAPDTAAVMAMIAGTSGTKPRRAQMPENTDTAAGAATAGTTQQPPRATGAPAAATGAASDRNGPATPQAGVTPPAGQAQLPAQPPASAQGGDAPAPAATASQPAAAGAAAPQRPRPAEMSAQDVRRIYDTAAAAGLSQTQASEIAGEDGMTLEAALDRISAHWRENGDVDRSMVGRPTARVLRDERETRRTGMTEALVAQMVRRAPTNDVATPFMAMSLVEMAASAVDWQGSLRDAGDRIDVMMAATHSTSDFPAIFENALNKVLLERYEMAQPTYRAVSRRITFNDYREHPMVRMGDFPALQEIGQGGEIKYGTVGESKEVAAIKSYAVALKISRQMIINDELGAIDQMLADYGSRVAFYEEEVFYAFMASAKLADGTAVWHSSRNNLAGSGGAITVDNVGAGRAAIRKQKSIDGKALNLTPSILLVSPDKETEAEKLVATVQPQQQSNVNPFSGRLDVVPSAQLTGNAWYLFADPARPGGACFVHGFLAGQEAPRVRFDEPFGQQGMAMSLEHDFGVGAIDSRGTWKNPGA